MPGIPSHRKQKIRPKLLHRQRGRCWYDGRRLTEATATLDHVTPLWLEGSNTDGNLVVACARCNGSKAGGTLEAYRAEVAARHGTEEWRVEFYGEGGRSGGWIVQEVANPAGC